MLPRFRSTIPTVILAVAIAALPLRAQSDGAEPEAGSRWLPYFTVTTLVSYVDTTRLVRLSEARFAAWPRTHIRSRDAAPKAWDAGTRFMLRRAEFDCDAVRSRTTRTITYDVSGRHTDDSGDLVAPAWEEPIPGSMGETEVLTLCALRSVLPLRGTP